MPELNIGESPEAERRVMDRLLITDQRPRDLGNAVTTKLEGNVITLRIDISNSNVLTIPLPKGLSWDEDHLRAKAVTALTDAVYERVETEKRHLETQARVSFIERDDDRLSKWVAGLARQKGRGRAAIVRASAYQNVEIWQEIGDWPGNKKNPDRPVFMRGSIHASHRKPRKPSERDLRLLLFTRYLRRIRFSAYDQRRYQMQIAVLIRPQLDRRSRGYDNYFEERFIIHFPVYRAGNGSTYWHDGKYHQCEPLPITERSSPTQIKRYRRWQKNEIIIRGRGVFVRKRDEARKQERRRERERESARKRNPESLKWKAAYDALREMGVKI